MTKKEFELWKNNDMSFGTRYEKRANENSHDYNPNEKYLHFFKNLEDAQTVASVLDIKANLLCKFSVDENSFKKFEGQGTYYYNGDMNFGTVKVTEYAIPTKLLSKENMVAYKPVKNLEDVQTLSINSNWKEIEKENNDLAM